MKLKKHIFTILLVVLLFLLIGSVSATDTNDTQISYASGNDEILSVENDLNVLSTDADDNQVSEHSNNEIVSAENNIEILSANQGYFSELADEIGNKKYVELNHTYYSFDSGSTIYISTLNAVINGKGAIIDMAGSTIQPFSVSTSGVTIKNLTIKNANNAEAGGAVYFKWGGTVENCNFTNNKAYIGGAIYFYDGEGTVTNCNFTNNTARYGGAINFYDKGTVTNCNFTNNKATGDYSGGGAIRFVEKGTVTNCNFANNSASNGGAICFDAKGTVSNCNFAKNSANSGVHIYSLNWYTTADTCIFKTDPDSNVNVFNFPPTLNVDNFITIFNSGENLTFDLKTNSGMPIYDGNISISVYNKDNDAWIGNYSCLSSEGWTVDLPIGHYYAIFNTEYADFKPINRTITILHNKTFAALNHIIKGNDDPVINLTNNYCYDPYFDAEFANGVVINRKVTINGNGYTIDAQGKARVFNVEASDATIENLTIKNGKYSDYDGLGSAVYFKWGGTVENCNFTNNTAKYGGAIYFFNGEGTVTNCNFTNNTASNRGGAIYFYRNGYVTNCNFANNHANIGGSISSYNTWAVTADTCIFKTDSDSPYNTHNLPPTLNIDDSQQVIISGEKLTFDLKTNSSKTVNNGNILISVYYKNNSWVGNYSCLSGEGWTVSLPEGYYFVIFDTEYAEFKAINRTITVIPNIPYYVNVTPVTTTNKTVNITAKSNIPQDIIQGKLQFILPNGDKINATYAINGTWWALYAFDNAGDYDVNASYIGLDDVSINNATIIIRYDASVDVNNRTLDLFVDDTFTIVATTVPEGLNVTYVTDDSSVVSVDNDGVVTALKEGTASITVKVGGDGIYSENSTEVAVTVSKIATEITLTNATVELKANKNIGDLAALYPADAGNLTYTSSDEDIVLVSEDGIIYARVKGTATVTVSFAGDYKYKAAESKNITVTVTLNDASVSVENDTLDLFVDDTYIINATSNPRFLTVYYTSSNESVATVTEYGNVKAVGEGTAVITLTVGNGETYAVNSTNVTVTVSKIATEISVLNDTFDMNVYDEIWHFANLTPAEAGDLSYLSGNKSVAFVVEGSIVAAGLGETTITVSFVGNDKYAAAENKTINVKVTLRDASVTVNNDTLELFVDDNFTINATTLPAGLDVTFVPDDSGVYSVDENGLVIALKNGTGNILVKVGGDGVYAENSTTVTVTVSKVPTEISVDPASLDLFVGDETVIAAALTPPEAGNVTFTSSDENIVTVDDKGNVIAVGEGSATITVSFAGDDKYAEAENVTVSVTVSKVPTEISIENATVDMEVNDEVSTGATLTPADAGNVTYTVSNSSVVKVEDGKIIALAEGSTTITVSFAGDDKYAEAENKTIEVTVKLRDASVSVENATLELLIGDNDTIVAVTVPEGLAVTYVPDDSGIISVDEDGVVTALKEGTASIIVKVGGDGVYAENTTTVTVTVSKVPTEISVDPAALDLVVGNESSIAATLTPADAGIVTFTSSDDSVVTVDDKGNVIAVGEGSATITVSFAGNDKYAAAENVTVSVFVAPKPKENATISIDAPSQATEGDNVTVTVTLPEDATGNVTIGNEVVPVQNGTASAVLTDIPAGNTTVPITYSGDDKYNPIETEVNITVEEDTSDIISAPDVTKYFHGSERFVITVTDYQGTPLAGKSVTIVVNGVSYSRTTNANGTTTVALGLDAGVYNVTTTMDNQTVDSVVTILTTVNGTDLVKVYRNATQYYATFLDSEGNYLAEGTEVQFNINGVLYTRKVAENGLAKLNINLEPGEYIITALNHETGEMSSNNITVIPRIVENSDLTKYYRNASQYTVKIIGDDGNPVGAGEEVTFNINGVMYTRATNASGIAKLNINLNPGDYIVTAEYKGCKVSNNIKVLPILTGKDITMKYRDGTKFVATLVDGQGKPYAEQTVQFNINGVFYNRVTDSTGQAKLNINLMAGQYIITSSYNGSNIANKITIRG